MEKSPRVCPTFKLYWIHDDNECVTKRYDHNQPFVTPEEVFAIIQKVYSFFNTHQHVVKYRDGAELIDFSKTDVIIFQFHEKFFEISLYIFSSKSCVHPQVVCDECNKSISTTRYKCLECGNYDACQDCMTTNLHDHHLMVVVPISFLKSQGTLYRNALYAIVQSAKKCIPQTIE